VVSFVAFHECGLSVPAGRFIRGVLFTYGLQLQLLNPNSIQQMAAFEAMCEGYLSIDAHWHLFQYFFRFTCLRVAPARRRSAAPISERSKAATTTTSR
jgi:hypothetical protein